MENELMKTTLCLTFTLFALVTLMFVPNSFAQDESPEYVIRQIYFHPSDLVLLKNIDATLDKWVGDVQQFYADEMERHGYGRKTFQLETDAQGNPVRHYVKGKCTNKHYRSNRIAKANEEIREQFDRSEHLIYLNFIKFDYNQDFSQVGGNASGSPFNGTANITLVDFDDNAPKILYTRAWTTIAHELGHAFGLQHDFRDDHYIMSYGPDELTDQLSSCAAEWLDAHRYFNTTQNPFSQGATIRMLAPSFVSLPNTIRLQFVISSSAELHQAQLLTNSLSHPGNPYFDEITVSDCKSLNGNNSTIEFVTAKLAPATEYVTLRVIDEHGNFTASQRFPIDLTVLLPESRPVSIPDANLAAAIRESLDLASGTVITEADMLGLGNLVPLNNSSKTYTYHSRGRPLEKQIKDLTGIEYATNLERLYFPFNAIRDITPITELMKLSSIDFFNNQIQDIGPLKKLTKLTYLQFSRNQIRDITPLASLPLLIHLSIADNQISDITHLKDLINLDGVTLDTNEISDLSPLSALVNLGHLSIGGNRISDIGPLAKLTNLRSLSLTNNNISNVSPLAKLTNLHRLALTNNNIRNVSPLSKLVNLQALLLQGNPIKHKKPLLQLLRMNTNVKIYLEHGGEPLPVNLSYFRADHTEAGVKLKWITESEMDNAGFYIYRSTSKDDQFKVVNPKIIQGAGTTGERNEYTWTDTSAKPNTVYYYRIEDVSQAGVREQLAIVRLRGLISAHGKLTTIWADLKAKN